MDLKTGDLILVKGKSFISEAIEEISHSQYSHTAGIVKENEIIEAEGFEKTGYEALDKYNNYDVYRCNILTDEQRKRIVEYVEKQIGTHYDYMLLLWEFIRYVWHIALPYREYHSHICSTLWADAYRSVGIDLCSVKYPSPGDLANSKLLRKVSSL